MARDLLAIPKAGCYPDGFLDDDPGRRGMRIDGVPVLGTIDEVGPVARRRAGQEVIIAIPSADRRAMRRIVERCREAQVTMKIVPGLEAVLSGRARVSEIREVGWRTSCGGSRCGSTPRRFAMPCRAGGGG